MIEIKKFFTHTRLSKVTKLLLLIRSLLALPSIIQLEPTTKCNLKCKHCIRTSEVNSDISISLFKSILKQLAPKNKRKKPLLFLTGLGEPFLNPNIFHMIKYAKRLGFQVGLTSNLTIMNQSIAKKLIATDLDFLSISIEYADKELFEFIREGAVFEKVLSNIQLLVQVRKQLGSNKPKITLESVIFDNTTINQIVRLIDLAKTLRVDGIVFPAQTSPHKIHTRYNELTCLLRHLSVKVNYIKIELISPSKICEALNRCYITFDGKVLPCSASVQLFPRKEYPRFQFGCLKAESFKNIWFSKRYKLFRIKVALGLFPYLCRYCLRSK